MKCIKCGEDTYGNFCRKCERERNKIAEHKNCKKSFNRSEFQKWGKIGGKKSLKRFEGKTKKEISEIMRKVSKASVDI